MIKLDEILAKQNDKKVELINSFYQKLPTDNNYHPLHDTFQIVENLIFSSLDKDIIDRLDRVSILQSPLISESEDNPFMEKIILYKDASLAFSYCIIQYSGYHILRIQSWIGNSYKRFSFTIEYENHKSMKRKIEFALNKESRDEIVSTSFMIEKLPELIHQTFCEKYYSMIEKKDFGKKVNDDLVQCEKVIHVYNNDELIATIQYNNVVTGFITCAVIKLFSSYFPQRPIVVDFGESIYKLKNDLARFI